MATLYVAECRRADSDNRSHAQAAVTPFLAEQTVAIGVSSTSSSAFNGDTNLIRVHTDAVCSIAIGSSPTATATNARLAADQTEYFAVQPGQKIAVITNA